MRKSSLRQSLLKVCIFTSIITRLQFESNASIAFAQITLDPLNQSVLKVTHLPQIHSVGGETKDDIDWIARSQHATVLYLLQHPNAVVIKEGLPRDLKLEDYVNPNETTASFKTIARNVFPRGIPSKFEDLNLTQKQFLADFSGVETLYYLGQRQTVFQANSQEEDDRIFGEVDEIERRYGDDYSGRRDDPRLRELIFYEREKLAVRAAMTAAEKPENTGKEIIIIYGDAHDFTSHFQYLSGVQFSKAEIHGVPKRPNDPMSPNTELKGMEDILGDLPLAVDIPDLQTYDQFVQEYRNEFVTISVQDSDYISAISDSWKGFDNMNERKIEELRSWGNYVKKDRSRFRAKLEAIPGGIDARIDEERKLMLAELNRMSKAYEDTKFDLRMMSLRIYLNNRVYERPFAGALIESSMRLVSLDSLDKGMLSKETPQSYVDLPQSARGEPDRSTGGNQKLKSDTSYDVLRTLESSNGFDAPLDAGNEAEFRHQMNSQLARIISIADRLSSEVESLLKSDALDPMKIQHAMEVSEAYRKAIDDMTIKLETRPSSDAETRMFVREKLDQLRAMQSVNDRVQSDLKKYKVSTVQPSSETQERQIFEMLDRLNNSSPAVGRDSGSQSLKIPPEPYHRSKLACLSCADGESGSDND